MYQAVQVIVAIGCVTFTIAVLHALCTQSRPGDWDDDEREEGRHG